MNFREFVTIYEARNYAVVQRDDGGFDVVGPYNKVWSAKIDQGQLVLPPELEPAREQIIAAYFHRPIFGAFHAPQRPQLAPEQDPNDDSDVIEPHVFGKPKSGNAPMAINKGGTFVFKPKNTPHDQEKTIDRTVD